MEHRGLNQLVCAAVVNSGFRESLLRNPAQALATGYYGHSFRLTTEERDLVTRIRTQKFEDFAAQIHRWITGEGSDEGQSVEAYNVGGHNGNSRSGDGRKHDGIDVGEPWVELVALPVPA